MSLYLKYNEQKIVTGMEIKKSFDNALKFIRSSTKPIIIIIIDKIKLYFFQKNNHKL